MQFAGSQLQAIQESDCLVLTAAPGSGKTTIIAQKIRRGIADSSVYYGAIAVSYTNKASNHLRDKCERGGVNISSCFFGTIDKFCMSEIIFPFGGKISASDTFEVLTYSELVLKEIEGLVLHPNEPFENHNNPHSISRFLDAGYILLELASEIALYVLNKSSACKKYLTSKYTHCVVDEYQDCSSGQHSLFMKLQDLELICIAAGDTQQSIFKFAKKDPRYLIDLTANDKFRHVSITENFRSHISIVEYANNFRERLELPSFPREESRVIHMHSLGDENDIYQTINSTISSGIYNRLDLRIGVLYRSNIKCERAVESVDYSFYAPQTPLDESSSIHSNVLIDILSELQSSSPNSYEIASRYFHEEFEQRNFQFVRSVFTDIKRSFTAGDHNDVTELSLMLAANMTGLPLEDETIEAFRATVDAPALLHSYAPVQKGILNIMTYHKAKGLEFDVVYMADLYQYILPNINNDADQEENIFYVGISRPKELLFLLTSTHRHDYHGNLRQAVDSEFITRNNGERFILS